MTMFSQRNFRKVGGLQAVAMNEALQKSMIFLQHPLDPWLAVLSSGEMYASVLDMVIEHVCKYIIHIIYKYVTVSAKTVPNGTFGISRNTILKH